MDKTSLILRLFRGEELRVEQHATRTEPQPAGHGCVALTTFRLVFIRNGSTEIDPAMDVALACISKVTRQNDVSVRILTKDVRALTLSLVDATKASVDHFVVMLQALAFPKDPHRLFAFSHKLVVPAGVAAPVNGWTIYQPVTYTRSP